MRATTKAIVEYMGVTYTVTKAYPLPRDCSYYTLTSVASDGDRAMHPDEEAFFGYVEAKGMLMRMAMPAALLRAGC
jgi:hypothetical protein